MRSARADATLRVVQSGSVTIRRAVASKLEAIVGIDDAATALYAEAGLEVALPAEHPFVKAEVERWREATALGRLFVAVDGGGLLVGFAAWGFVDGAPYLDQLSVVPRAMRRGIGRALLERVFEAVGAAPLWLTTYAHLEWNRSYYERFGFEQVPEAKCGPEMLRILLAQREALPHPEQRIAMVRAAR